mmetsp:Transcript_36879/g.78646  ORF Transcript_36879/g.78646 Transcript_36879/m.78646 type:complete len:238 (+) Transcript_36879:1139-1852(+)
MSLVSAEVPASATRFSSFIWTDWVAIVDNASSNLACSSSISRAWLVTIFRRDRTDESPPAAPSASDSSSSSPWCPASIVTTRRRTTVTLRPYHAANALRSMPDRSAPAQYGRGSGRFLYSSTMFRYFPTPMDWIMFMMVEPSMTTSSMLDVSPLLADERPFPPLALPSESDMYSRHRPRRSPLRAGTATTASADAARFFERSNTPRATLDGDDRTSITARGISMTHSESNLSSVTVT